MCRDLYRANMWRYMLFWREIGLFADNSWQRVDTSRSKETYSRTHTCDIKTRTHLFIRVTCIVWHEKCSFIRMCDMARTHSCVWQDAFTAKNRTHMYDKRMYDKRNILWCFFFSILLHSKQQSFFVYIWMRHVTIMNDSFSYSWHDAFIHRQTSYIHDRTRFVNESSHIQQCIMSQIWICHFTYINRTCVIYINEFSFKENKMLTYEWMRHDKTRVNSCVLKDLFFWGSSAAKKFTQNPWKCIFRRTTAVTFSKFRRCKKKPKGSN